MDKRVKFASYFAMFTFGMANGSLGPLLIPIADFFKLEVAQVGYPVVFSSMGFFTAGIFTSFVWNIRRASFILFFFSLSLSAASFCIFFLHTSIKIILIFLFLIGLSGGMLHCGTNSLFAEIFVKKRAGYLSLLLVFFGLGAFLGPLVVGAILTFSVGWYIFYFFLGTVALSLSFFFKKDIKPEVVRINEHFSRHRPALSLFFWVIALVNFLAMGVQSSYHSWIPFFLTRARDISPAVASYSVSLFWISMMGGRALFARFSHKVDLYISLIFATGCSALFFTLSFLTAEILLIVLSLIFSGMLFSFVSPGLRALGGNIFSGHIGFVIGILTGIGSVGSTFLPWFVGWLSQEIGITWGVLIIPFFSGLISVVLFKMRSSQKIG